MRQWSSNDLFDHLWSVATARAARAGRQFEVGAEQDLQALIRRGATELTLPSTPPDLSVAQAVVDVVDMVELMIRAAEDIPGYPRHSLGEKTFSRMKQWFCPRRPFC